MFSAEIDYLVRQEQYKDLQRDIVRQQLIQTVKLQPLSKTVLLRKMAGRLGTQMVAWGSKLQYQEQYRHQTLSR